MITAAQIRTQYPRPISTGTCPTTRYSYCVGGALYLYVHSRESLLHSLLPAAPTCCFPGVGEIRHLLQHENPALSFERADFAAMRIVALNDIGQFEESWQALDWALTCTDAVDEHVESEGIHEGELVPA